MVLLLAWETWCPTWGFLPVTWQTRAIQCSAGKGRIIGRNRVRVQAQSQAQRRIRRGSSQQPAFGKGHRAAARDDEMVEHLDIDQGERAFQRAGEDLVGLAWLRDTGGVVMREDRRCTIMPKRRLHDLAGVNRGLRERPGEHALRGDDAVLRIEPQAPELLPLATTEREPEVVPDRAGEIGRA